MNDLIYLLLGSNLGDREAILRRAIEELEKKGFSIQKNSAIYETDPWGLKDQPVFLNIVIAGKWDSSPEDLLTACQEIEVLSGRVRTVKWGERILDIDILYYGTTMISTEVLTIPHPGIPVRRFTLIPLNEIAADKEHPVLKKTTGGLLEVCEDDIGVKFYSDF